ncbi:MAG: hypothetical protein WBB00_16040 [Mycobacterium sp.]
MKLLLPSAFGVLMVGASAYRADGAALIAAGAALIAVLIAGWWRPGAIAAVLLTVLTILLADPAPLYTALAGLAATAYLVLRHEDPTRPTMLFAVVFASTGAIAVLAPVNVAWLPLAAPLVLLAGYLLALRPYLIRSGTANRV